MQQNNFLHWACPDEEKAAQTFAFHFGTHTQTHTCKLIFAPCWSCCAGKAWCVETSSVTYVNICQLRQCQSVLWWLQERLGLWTFEQLHNCLSDILHIEQNESRSGKIKPNALFMVFKIYKFTKSLKYWTKLLISLPVFITMLSFLDSYIKSNNITSPFPWKNICGLFLSDNT